MRVFARLNVSWMSEVDATDIGGKCLELSWIYI